MNDTSFVGRVVLVTGGTRGVGRGIAEAFLARGAEVLVCGRRAPDVPVRGGAREATFLPADVRESADQERIIGEILARHGRLDVLVNNAGGSPGVATADASPRFLRAIVALNLTAPMELCVRACPVMQAQPDGGVIVNIASVSGTRPSPETAAYGAAKAGLLNLTRTLAVEWGPRIRVNAVVAGLLATEQVELHYGDAEAQAAVAATVPAGRLGSPEDVANACLFLASPAASYISGACLAVDGGGETPAFLTAVRSASGPPQAPPSQAPPPKASS